MLLGLAGGSSLLLLWLVTSGMSRWQPPWMAFAALWLLATVGLRLLAGRAYDTVVTLRTHEVELRRAAGPGSWLRYLTWFGAWSHRELHSSDLGRAVAVSRGGNWLILRSEQGEVALPAGEHGPKDLDWLVEQLDQIRRAGRGGKESKKAQKKLAKLRGSAAPGSKPS